MATTRSRTSRLLKPLFYTATAGAATATVLYFTYRPRDIPGSEPAAVPPPIYGEGGIFSLPDFPAVKTRADQIAALKRSAAANERAVQRASWLGQIRAVWSRGKSSDSDDDADEDDEPYDLLIIGAGATGSGIALDAATRGLKVAVVERDDFSSGTSSKSTKLVHGGVRYLEKAVWEMDYSQ